MLLDLITDRFTHLLIIFKNVSTVTIIFTSPVQYYENKNS